MKIKQQNYKQSIYSYLKEKKYVVFYLNNNIVLNEIIKDNYKYYRDPYRCNKYGLFYLHKNEIRFIIIPYFLNETYYKKEIYELNDFYNNFVL